MNREQVIDQLCQSYNKLEEWDKAACRHAMHIPAVNQYTGKPFESFKEVLEVASDHTLEILLDDFEFNGFLVPAVGVN